MPGSEYGNIPYEVDEITTWLETWFNDNLPGVLEDALDVSLFDPLFKEWNIIYSETLRKSSDVEASTSSASWVKLKEFTIAFSNIIALGTIQLTVKHDHKTVPSGSVTYTRIYKNGVAVGTNRARTADTWGTWSENIGGWSNGDKVQLYALSDGSRVAWVRNFRLYFDKDPIQYIEPVWED